MPYLLPRRRFLQSALAATALGSPPATHGKDKFPWLRTSRLVLAEGYVPPFYPRLECTGQRLAELTAAMGADALRFPAISRYALYPTHYYPHHPDLAGRDLFRETIEACRARRLRVIPYVAVNVAVWPEDTEGEVAGWIGVDEKGRPTTSTLFSLDRPERFLQACLLSPMQDRIKAYVREIVRNYDIDGIYFDGPYPYMSSQKCYCRFCQAAYRRDRGKDLPVAGAALSRAAEREYYEWFSIDVAQKLMREVRQIVLAEKDIPLIFNLTPFLFTRGYSAPLAEVCDAFMFESRPGPITNKMYHLLLGQTTGKRLWSYVSTPHLSGTDHLRAKRLGAWYSQAVDGGEVAAQSFAVIAAGAAPIYWGVNNRYRSEGALGPLKESFAYLERNQRTLQNLRTARYAGILTSRSSIDWYRYQPSSASGYSNAFYYGAYALLQDARVQSEPFGEGRLTAEWLAQYRVVYLPNAACLSDAQAEVLRRYVESGGALLATYESSLYDERGEKRRDFALADVFGAHWKESPDWLTDLFLKLEPGAAARFSAGVTELPQDPDVTFLTADDEASVAGRTVQEARRSVLSPGLIVRSFGKGRVAYLAGSPEAVYYESHLEILPGFTRRLIEHLAGEPAPYDLEAPAGVYAQLAVDADNMVLHLLCDIGNKWKGLASREQYIPVPKITAQIRLPRSRKPRSVRLLRRNSPVSFRFRDGRLAVDLADVSIYEAVHIELL